MANLYMCISLWITIILLSTCALGELRRLGLAFTRLPHDVTVVRREPWTWDCAAESAIEPPQISWRHLGSEVDSRRVHVLENGSLTFRSVLHKKGGERSDQGEYQCLASNQLGTLASPPATLTVAGLSQFSKHPENQTAVEGQTVHLDCRIEGQPPPAISWEQHRLPLTLDNNRYTVLPSGTLQIRDIQTTDSGSYHCIASNVVKSRTSKEAYLRVNTKFRGLTELPQFLVQPQSQTKSEGESVLLDCAASGLPAPIIQWFKGGTMVELDGRHSLVGQGSLSISDLSHRADNGTYECRCTGGSGTPVLSVNVSLLVATPPRAKYEADYKPVKVVKLYMLIYLKCNFSGYPKPSVSWMKDGKVITADDEYSMDLQVYEDGTLALQYTAMFNQGIYQCWGSNPAGTAVIEHRIQINTRSLPVPPENFRGRSLGATRVRLQWDAPRSESIKTFIVNYRRANIRENWISKILLESEGHNKIIGGLRPFSNYTFFMVNVNEWSTSIRSKEIVIATEESVPLVPAEATLQPSSVTSLEVSWRPLTLEEAQGVVTRYRIKYREHTNRLEEKYLELHGQHHQYTITELNPGTLYDVLVIPGTAVGYPEDDPEWQWAQATTSLQRNGSPERPVLDLEVTGSDAVEVHWDRPSPGSPPVLGYDLKYRVVQENLPQHWIQLSVQGLNNTRRISELEPDTSYEVRLQAYNNIGSSQYDTKTVKTRKVAGSTIDDVILHGRYTPDAPSDVVLRTRGPTEIFLNWTSPDPNITLYTIHYHSLHHKESAFCTVNTSKTSIEISDLKPYTVYEFYVQSMLGDIPGKFTELKQFRTQPGLPSAPDDLKVLTKGDTTVYLKWRPPQEKNGIIIQYIILYSMDKIEPDQNWIQREENGTAQQASVGELTPDALYYFKLRAATEAGKGPPTDPVEVKTVLVYDGQDDEQLMGIIIGVCIGGGCIIICALLIVFRNRLCPPLSHPDCQMDQCYQGNSAVASRYANEYSAPPTLVLGGSRRYETTPMLDSKGAAGGYPEQTNGLLPMNGLQAAVMSNGEVRTFLVQECRGTNRNSGPMILHAMNGRCSHHPSRDGSTDDLDHNSEVTNSDIVMTTMVDTPGSVASDLDSRLYPYRPNRELETSFVTAPDGGDTDTTSNRQRLSTCSHTSTDNPCACPHPDDLDNTKHDIVNGNLLTRHCALSHNIHGLSLGMADKLATPHLHCGGDDTSGVMDGSRPPPNSPLPVVT